MSPKSDLADQLSRDEAILQPKRSMLLVAGAGTGKTRTMVERLVESVRQGQTLDRQVAITFTVKAAHELVERLRDTLELEDSPAAREALAQLSNMRAGTIDKIVQRLLEENAVEAGLAAGFRILTPNELQDRFDLWFGSHIEVWRTDEALSGAWDSLTQLELKRKSFEGLLKNIAFHVIRHGRSMSVYDGESDLERILATLVGRIDDLRIRAPLGPEKLIEKAQNNVRILERNLALCEIDPFAPLEPLLSMATTGGPSGKPLRDEIKEACELISGLVSGYRYIRIVPLLRKVVNDANDFAHGLNRQGLLDFDRALSLAIHVLEGSEAALTATQSQIDSVMVDEFQDTSANQVCLMNLLCGGGAPWFVVGDPKQSIYRFRGADLDCFLGFHEDARRNAVSVRNLTSNFRSHHSVLSLVNDVLAPEFMASDGAGYEALVPQSPGRERIESHCQVVGNIVSTAEDVANKEAELTVLAVLQAIGDRWQVRTKEAARAIELSDIAVLYRSRSNLENLTAKLAEAGIPFRIEGESDVMDTDEVRAVINVLRAVSRSKDRDDDATIQIARVGAMRSLSFTATLSDLFDTSALADFDRRLLGLRDALEGVTPFQAVSYVIREFGLDLLGAVFPRPRAVINRLRTLMDRALAAESEGILSVRDFVDIVDADEKGLIESPAPEHDERAIRLMTVHAAKGLEFPMVLVLGFSSDPKAKTCLLNVDPLHVAIRVGTKSQAEPAVFQVLANREKQADDEESKRLLYVAMTRAQDHLIVSSYHHGRSPNLIRRVSDKSNAEAERMLVDAGNPVRFEPPKKAFEFRDTIDIRAKWSLLAQTNSRTTPTKLAHTVDENDLDSNDPTGVVENAPSFRPTAKQGTTFGRAVHMALQSIAFENPMVQQAADSAASLYGSDAARIAAFVERALRSAPVIEASTSPQVWREVYAAVLRDEPPDQLLEGILDLVYDRPDGTLGVIDYKTDQVHSESDARESMDRAYRKQGEGYRELLSKATGIPVSRVSFVFLAMDPAAVCDVA